MAKISFFNQKGGVGKSTLILQTAAGLADKGASVCIIDLDTQRSCLTFYKNCKNPNFDVVASEKELKNLMSIGKTYGTILYDHSPERDIANLPGMGCDLAIVPFQASALDYLSTGTALNALDKRGQKVLTVLNRFVAGRALSKDFDKKVTVDCKISEKPVYVSTISSFCTIYTLDGFDKFTYAVQAKQARAEIDALIQKIGEKLNA